jgi:hypothetical protein
MRTWNNIKMDLRENRGEVADGFQMSSGYGPYIRRKADITERERTFMSELGAAVSKVFKPTRSITNGGLTQAQLKRCTQLPQ